MSDPTSLPTPYAAARIAAFLAEHLSWSAFWDKREGVWRVSENDPDSELYAASRDADTVIRYMAANSMPVLGERGRGLVDQVDDRAGLRGQ
jgi:hypothetical protein